MSIAVTAYTDQHERTWDAFVRESRNGTFFHTRKFLAYHPQGKFTDASVLFMDGHKVIGVLTAATVEEKGKRWLVSHPGASYGGLVLGAKNGMQETEDMLTALRTHAQKQHFDGVRFLRLTPPILRQASSDDQEYWLYQQGWSCVRFELATSYSLIGMTQETVLESFVPTTRNKVRQAEKHELDVRFSEDFPAFWALLEATLKGRHGAKPTHTLEDIERLRSLTGNDVRLLAAYQGKTMIAGLVVITNNPKSLYILYTGQEYELAELRAVSLLVYKLFQIAIQEGRQVLDFGISTEDGGKVANASLFAFKEGFGGESVRRESWEIVL